MKESKYMETGIKEKISYDEAVRKAILYQKKMNDIARRSISDKEFKTIIINSLADLGLDVDKVKYSLKKLESLWRTDNIIKKI